MILNAFKKRIILEGSMAHLKRDMRPKHGPQQWPWWRLFALGPCRLNKHLSTTSGYVGRRLWIYTRWGAVYFDVIFAPERR